MNQHKKRKFSDVTVRVPLVKKFKIDPQSKKLFKDKKKKELSVSSKNDETKVSNKSDIQSDSQNSLKKKSGTNRQWQSTKEKRKRFKKKYALKDDKSKNITSDGQNKQKQPESDTVKLPKSSDEYSANWKNLMKTLNIPKTKKKKKQQKEKGQTHQVNSNDEKEKEPEIWFDDVDDILLERKPVSTENKPDKLVKEQSFTGLTKDVAMDCEMVGVGWNSKESQLARVSIVNHSGHCVFDKFVKPKEKVTDYRTHVSGIRPEDLEKGEKFEVIQKEVAAILLDRVLIGHALHNDLQVLYISHPKKMIRDTSRYKPFRQLFDGRNPSLKKLTAKVLGVTVQEGEHNSIQDAQAAMRLYTMYKQQWEKDLRNKQILVKKGPKKKKKLKS